ncbi:uncharacterized protein PHACADRAFT_169504 [Phanerochaete carnosa HHB-10118-sp]|uniref:Ribosomal protein S36, mitochondrial n=1 Tax=Phanerochaete carnosa (strain HHB-10118-sp) TaxID=650164 RepID=K5V8B1_PHACS|nr:uncharacterized protein PHACADRAFT_169504 [Phanerochaete carnosa HHB-10118-sp]EKM59041.1 hypothetical protein PHACADRAFT_169504 [Phanerochaete carnosa HHB-10118-sp]
MRPSLRLLNAASHRVHKPLIQFVGKRQWPSTPEPQHPHPFAPTELQNAFSDFLNKFKASASAEGSSQSSMAASSASGKNGETVQVFTDFWQAPERLWRRRISEEEIEVITSGGAY